MLSCDFCYSSSKKPYSNPERVYSGLQKKPEAKDSAHHAAIELAGRQYPKRDGKKQEELLCNQCLKI